MAVPTTSSLAHQQTIPPPAARPSLICAWFGPGCTCALCTQKPDPWFAWFPHIDEASRFATARWAASANFPQESEFQLLHARYEVKRGLLSASDSSIRKAEAQLFQARNVNKTLRAQIRHFAAYLSTHGYVPEREELMDDLFSDEVEEILRGHQQPAQVL